MGKVRGHGFFLIAVVLLVAVAVAVFYFDSVGVELAPRPSVKIAPPYCETPVFLANFLDPYNSFSLQIDGRNIVYVDKGVITFYDLGLDHKKSLDDLGFIRPLPTTGFGGINIKYTNPVIYENNLFLIRWVSTWAPDLVFYSLGNDGIAGTPDDSGPSLIYTGNIGSLHIDKNFVSFEATTSTGTDSLYCTLDNQDCQNQIISNLNSVITASSTQTSNGEFARGSGDSSYWGYFFKHSSNVDIYFIDNILQQSLFIAQAYLLDYSDPFLLIKNRLTSELALGISGAPGAVIPLSNSQNAQVMAIPNHWIPNPLKFPVAWAKFNLPRIDYKVTVFPSMLTIDVPSPIPPVRDATVPLSPYHTNYPVAIDEDTLVVTDTERNIYISECYF
ncbi:MAG: hypothetical protein AABX96_02955 [Nanoarchaeota archaeon]